LGEGKGHCSGSQETNNVSLGSAQDSGSTAGKMGQGQARKKGRLRPTSDTRSVPALGSAAAIVPAAAAQQEYD